MLIGISAQLRGTNHISEIVVTGSNLKPVAAIKSLGAILDSRLTLAAHVTAVCKACYYHKWALCRGPLLEEKERERTYGERSGASL